MQTSLKLRRRHVFAGRSAGECRNGLRIQEPRGQARGQGHRQASCCQEARCQEARSQEGRRQEGRTRSRQEARCEACGQEARLQARRQEVQLRQARRQARAQSVGPQAGEEGPDGQPASASAQAVRLYAAAARTHGPKPCRNTHTHLLSLTALASPP